MSQFYETELQYFKAIPIKNSRKLKFQTHFYFSIIIRIKPVSTSLCDGASKKRICNEEESVSVDKSVGQDFGCSEKYFLCQGTAEIKSLTVALLFAS